MRDVIIMPLILSLAHDNTIHHLAPRRRGDLFSALRKPTERSVDWLDRLAVGASFACVLHCVGLPLVIVALPALASILSLPESVHLWVLAFAIPTAGMALASGFARHADPRPLLVGACGLSLLMTAGLLTEGSAWETPATVAGSALLAGAHLWNWRRRHACPARR